MRGKRKRSEALTKDTSTRSNPRLRGRPTTATADLRSKKCKILPSRTVFQSMMQSWIERLPIELLECIFLHSLEINMVHALPILGKALSKESIYRVLILFALFEDDRQHSVERKRFDPASYRVLSDKERSRLQMAVLQSRWCTTARIKECLPTLMRLATVQLWHKEHETEARRLAAPAAHYRGGPQQQARTLIPPLGDPSTIHEDFNAIPSASWLFDTDADFRIEHDDINHRSLSLYEFPPRLLQPASWRPDTNTPDPISEPMDLLTLLWNCVFSCNNSSQSAPLADKPTLFLGLATAIREHHHPAVRLLLKTHEQCASTERHGSDAENAAGPQVPLALVHLATRQGRESEPILKLLLGWGSKRERSMIPKDDDVLTKWALRWEERGSQYASWLLNVMERAGVDVNCASPLEGK
jgi:hypothetical protein